MKRKTVYVAMAADILHHGHIRLIKTAQKYGEVTLGLLTDEAIAEYKRVPVMKFAERKAVIECIQGVTKVVPQKSFDYIPNLKKIKPAYVVHGDDWKSGVQSEMRRRVIEVLKGWGGRLIEPRYTKGISSTELIRRIRSAV